MCVQLHFAQKAEEEARIAAEKEKKRKEREERLQKKREEEGEDAELSNEEEEEEPEVEEVQEDEEKQKGPSPILKGFYHGPERDFWLSMVSSPVLHTYVRTYILYVHTYICPVWMYALYRYVRTCTVHTCLSPQSGVCLFKLMCNNVNRRWDVNTILKMVICCTYVLPFPGRLRCWIPVPVLTG